MGHDTLFSQLCSAVNGPDLKRIRDACLRHCLSQLQTACRNLARLGYHRKDAVATFRSALQTAHHLKCEHLCWRNLCWRDKRTLRRTLMNAFTLQLFLVHETT